MSKSCGNRGYIIDLLKNTCGNFICKYVDHTEKTAYALQKQLEEINGIAYLKAQQNRIQTEIDALTTKYGRVTVDRSKKSGYHIQISKAGYKLLLKCHRLDAFSSIIQNDDKTYWVMTEWQKNVQSLLLFALKSAIYELQIIGASTDAEAAELARMYIKQMEEAEKNS